LRPARPLTGPADLRTVDAGIDPTAPASNSRRPRKASGEGLADLAQSTLDTARLLCWTSRHVKAGLLGAAAYQTQPLKNSRFRSLRQIA
jgi:hypothetical protein